MAEAENGKGSEGHGNADGGGPPTFEIRIDRDHFKVTQEQMTGADLRQLPENPIGPDRDLFQVVPGGSDEKILDDAIVNLKNGARFFTAPAQINPGG